MGIRLYVEFVDRSAELGLLDVTQQDWDDLETLQNAMSPMMDREEDEAIWNQIQKNPKFQRIDNWQSCGLGRVQFDVPDCVGRTEDREEIVRLLHLQYEGAGRNGIRELIRALLKQTHRIVALSWG